MQGTWKLRHMLGEQSKKQIIFEVETLAAILSAFLWKDLFLNKRVILFVDNEGTKFSLLKGMSDNPCVDKMAELFASLESKLHFWVSRVPSKNNVADLLSRGVKQVPFLASALDESMTACGGLSKLVMQFGELGAIAA